MPDADGLALRSCHVFSRCQVPLFGVRCVQNILGWRTMHVTCPRNTFLTRKQSALGHSARRKSSTEGDNVD
jgi:hypothetical protein